MKNNVRKLRRSEKFDISQQKLADALGVSRQTIVDIEKGERNLSAELAFKIADYFGKEPREIFFVDYVVSNLQKSNSA